MRKRAPVKAQAKAQATPAADALMYLAAFVAATDDAIVGTTVDGVITSWNRAAEKLFGYTPAETVGKAVAMIVPDDRRPEGDELFARLRHGDTIADVGTVRVAQDGRRVEAALTMVPVKNAQGRIVGAVTIARAITLGRPGDEARARLAAIVDSSDDVIISTTLDGLITSWNHAADKVFSYTAAAAIGRHISLIIPTERRAEGDDVLARIRRGDKVDHFETVRVAKDGRRIPVSLTVSPVKDAGGHIIGASKIARDISERQRAERERNEWLARERAARAEAEALNRAKDEFLAVVSHELRTPLNAVSGWARMLQSGLSDPRVAERAIDAIVRNAAAQAKLIDDLLDVSRIITGNMRLDVRPIDLKAVVEAALDSVRPAAAAKGIRLQSVLDPKAAAIIGAPDRLQQVVWNLLSNAVKFTPKGGRIRLYLRRVRAHVELVVRDTGEGISAEVLPHIFERFRQGDSSSTRAHGGLGLGLALVRHLVELHGGSVKADSPGVGRGATFTVKLPVALVQPATARAPRTPAAADAGGTTPPSLRGLAVLVVDDDIDGLNLATMILTNAGAEVKVAASAAAGAEIFATWRPHVVLADIEVPGEDGFAFLRMVRALESARAEKTPVLALTPDGGPDGHLKTLTAGFTLHLAKPVDPAELVTAVANAVGRTG